MERRTEDGHVLISGGHTAPQLARFSYRSQRTFVYKHTPHADLEIAVHFPFDLMPGDKRPGIIFYFGGGFHSGTREQFTRHCTYYASRGLIAATADYRVKRYHGTGLAECVEDTVDAMVWFKQHAGEFGMDPDRVAAGGGSAGATLAAVLAVVEDNPATAVSPRPDALVLFNPALDMPGSATEEMLQRLQIKRDELHHISIKDRMAAPFPPTWVWFGTEDRLYTAAKPVIEQMRSLTDQVRLELVDGADHGFFNDYEEHFHSSIRSLDEFLQDIAFLP